MIFTQVTPSIIAMWRMMPNGLPLIHARAERGPSMWRIFTSWAADARPVAFATTEQEAKTQLAATLFSEHRPGR